MNALSFILLGICLLLSSVVIYQEKRYRAVQKRFLERLTEKDKEIDKLEKTPIK